MPCGASRIQVSLIDISFVARGVALELGGKPDTKEVFEITSAQQFGLLHRWLTVSLEVSYGPRKSLSQDISKRRFTADGQGLQPERL